MADIRRFFIKKILDGYADELTRALSEKDYLRAGIIGELIKQALKMADELEV